MSWITPKEAKTKYQSYLTYYETKEIDEYSAVYYVGETTAKINGSYHASTNNFGYDDADGAYKIIPHDHIGYRYEILKVLGKGTSSQAVKCYDHKLEKYVAIKVTTNKEIFKDNAINELEILDKLRKIDRNNEYNVIHMLENFTFRNHICIVFELLSMNLYELIQKNNYKGFSLRLIRKFVQSILECLDLLKKKNIIHCDLKPENILLREKGKSSVKIIDFGSACYENYTMYQYIQSRAYRAPEVILGCKYTAAIDMWSLGCIMTELFTGHTLFPGNDEDDQMACIIEMLGMPPASVLSTADRKYNFITSKGYPRYCTVTQPDGQAKYTDGRNKYGKTRGYPGTKSLNQVLSECDDKSFIDFIKRCLEWDPTKRLTPSQALQHEFINRYRDSSKPPVYLSSKSTINNNYGNYATSASTIHNHHHNHHNNNTNNSNYSHKNLYQSDQSNYGNYGTYHSHNHTHKPSNTEYKSSTTNNTSNNGYYYQYSQPTSATTITSTSNSVSKSNNNNNNKSNSNYQSYYQNHSNYYQPHQKAKSFHYY
jgi:dual specificity tyrosine-phosphorylation-regulated kinase 2/3/4